MLCAESLTKHYKSTAALQQLSLEIPEGTVFGILGPNGAGKTTFLRLVMGFVFPTGGTIDRGELSPADIGYLPERAFYPPRFSIHSYLHTLARLVGLKGSLQQEEVARLLRQVGLFEAADQRLGACSRGMLQRLGLAQALLGNPDLLVLDEPALGLDPTGQVFMREQISALHQLSKTVLLSSHHLDEVTRVCTHVAVLSRGRLVRTGPLSSMLSPRSSVAIETSLLSADLASRLSLRFPDATIAERKIILDGNSVLHKAELLRLLLDEGVDIRRLSEEQTSLEAVYMEAIDW